MLNFDKPWERPLPCVRSNPRGGLPPRNTVRGRPTEPRRVALNSSRRREDDGSESGHTRAERPLTAGALRTPGIEAGVKNMQRFLTVPSTHKTSRQMRPHSASKASEAHNPPTRSKAAGRHHLMGSSDSAAGEQPLWWDPEHAQTIQDRATSSGNQSVKERLASEWRTCLVPNGLHDVIDQWDAKELRTARESTLAVSEQKSAPKRKKSPKKRFGNQTALQTARAQVQSQAQAQTQPWARSATFSGSANSDIRHSEVVVERGRARAESTIQRARRQSVLDMSKLTLRASEHIDVGTIEDSNPLLMWPAKVVGTFPVESSEASSLDREREREGLPPTDADDDSVTAVDVGDDLDKAVQFKDDDFGAYFGLQARRHFFQRYNRSVGRVETCDEQDLERGGHGTGSPRSRFLRHVIEAGHRQQQNRDAGGRPSGGSSTLPWPVLQRKMTEPKRIDLSGLGVGDEAVLGLTKVLPELPHVCELSLRGCRLSDVSLAEVCRSVTNMPHITWLDISENDMDDSAEVLRDYLGSSNCMLKHLGLNCADIDDYECCKLMSALESNKVLTSLSIARNIIGDAEMLNTLNPDLLTGGEATAQMLSSNRALQHLDISWNTVRKDSADELARSLRFNNTLLSLNLSHNTFADLPSQALGDALCGNLTLKRLDISYNSLTPSAAMVIANSFKQNVSLEELILDGNAIGRNGAEALHAAVRRAQTSERFVRLSLVNCDTETFWPKLFNPLEPTGKYVLRMETPYARMVAAELFRLACTRLSTQFNLVQHRRSDELTSLGTTTIELVRGESPLKRDNDWKPYADEVRNSLLMMHDTTTAKTQKRVVDSVRCFFYFIELHPEDESIVRIFESISRVQMTKDTSAQEIANALFTCVFKIVDTDHSEQVDAEELALCLSFLQIETTTQNVTRIITRYDTDSTGSIERDEFVQWLHGEYLTSKGSARGTLLDKLTGMEWLPPEDGVLILNFECLPMPPGFDMIGSDAGVDGLVKNILRAPNDAERMEVFERAVCNSDIFLTSKQAQTLLETCSSGGNESKLDLLSKLLPQMAGPDHACELIQSNLTLDLQVRARCLRWHIVAIVADEC